MIPPTPARSPSHVARTTRDDDPVALAKHAIRLLEKRIEQEYGLNVVMGAELEFTLLPQQDKAVLPKDFFGVLNNNDRSTVLGDNPSSVTRKPTDKLAINHPDPWFPNSARINRTYQEEDTKTPWVQLETVLSHEPQRMAHNPDGHDTARNVARDPLTLARTLEAVRYRIQNPVAGWHQTIKPSRTAGYFPSTKNRSYILGEAQVAYWQDVRKNDVASLSFSAIAPDNKTRNGLHLNMSLETSNGTILSETNPDRAAGEGILSRLALGIGVFMESNLYLLGGSSTAYERWNRDPGKTYTRFCVLEKNYDNIYIENKLPPADCNPYYAVMLQLAATYHALQEQKFRRNPDTKHYELDGAHCPVWHNQWTRQANQAFFENDSSLRKVLNAVEESLGDQFYAAIDKCPPGTEKTAMDRRHASLENIGTNR